MNIYEPYEAFFGVDGHFWKKIFFFCFFTVQKAVFASFSFIRFIKWLFLVSIRAARYSTTIKMLVFMNLMKIYEGGFFKRFFGHVGYWDGVSVPYGDGFMNLENMSAS